MATDNRKSITLKRLSNKDLERRLLLNGITNNDLNRFKAYLFEVVCQEAKYLHLYEHAESNRDYYATIGRMTQTKIRDSLEELYSIVNDMKIAYGNSKLQLTFDYREIPQLLRKKYGATRTSLPKPLSR